MNHNALPEITCSEFTDSMEDLLGPSSPNSHNGSTDMLWFHFEGRIPETTLACIMWLRDHDMFKDVGQKNLTISVELEKPGREGLHALALAADVVFYSSSWAKGEGYVDAESCLRDQARILRQNSPRTSPKSLICPWGAEGASSILLSSMQPFDEMIDASDLQVVHSDAYVASERRVVDTTGAGDTFIAGTLFGLICRGPWVRGPQAWPMKSVLDFANNLAGRKITQAGLFVEDISFMDG